MVNTMANERVRKVLEGLVSSGEELGLQVAAYKEGELVIDTWAGVADESTGRKVDGDTLFTVMSTTKGITATCIHILADRDALDYDKPIAYYWPEFAAKGKGEATVRHALTHSVGIPQSPPGMTPEMMCDWDAMCKAVAALEPQWKPGTKTGYHGGTFGWILGEVLRRIDGRLISRFVQEEINQPLGIEDLYFGIPDAVEDRVATLKDAVAAYSSAGTVAGTRAALFNRQDVRRACLPHGGGIMNARSMARHYAMLAGMGTLGRTRLMSPERVEMARTLQTDAKDEALGYPVAKGMGYFLGGSAFPALGPTRKSFGNPGSGGSRGFCDPENRLAVGFTKTLLQAGPAEGAARQVAQEIRSALGIPAEA